MFIFLDVSLLWCEVDADEVNGTGVGSVGLGVALLFYLAERLLCTAVQFELENLQNDWMPIGYFITFFSFVLRTVLSQSFSLRFVLICKIAVFSWQCQTFHQLFWNINKEVRKISPRKNIFQARFFIFSPVFYPKVADFFFITHWVNIIWYCPRHYTLHEWMIFYIKKPEVLNVSTKYKSNV